MTLLVTILTGRRPAYLEETLRALESAVRTCEGAQVFCWINGADAPSVEVAAGFNWITQVERQQEFRPIGPNVSRLAEAARSSGLAYWLHMEDDWKAEGDDGWISDACSILDHEATVGQVRLRRADEPVSRSNLVSHRMIRWHPRPIFRRRGALKYRVARAHATYNPSVMRAGQAAEWMIASSEPEAMRKFHASKMLVAQTYPGVFRHIGEKSLRRQTGG